MKNYCRLVCLTTHFIFLASLFSIARAQNVEINLLWNAYPTDSDYLPDGESPFNNKSFFYSKWSLLYKDGSPVPTDKLPYSCFGEVILYEGTSGGNPYTSYQIPYNGTALHLSSDPSPNYPVGTEVIILDYPNYKTTASLSAFEYCRYSFPIQVNYPTEYLLSGYMIPTTNIDVTKLPSNILNQAHRLVAVAEKENPGNNTLSVENINGVNIIVVRDANGTLLPTINFEIPKKCDLTAGPFSETFNLDPDYKFISLYAPAATFIVKDLKLTGDVPLIYTGIQDQFPSPDIDSVLRFDISGRPIAPDILPTPGIYIERRGNKSSKVFVK